MQAQPSQGTKAIVELLSSISSFALLSLSHLESDPPLLISLDTFHLAAASVLHPACARLPVVEVIFKLELDMI